MKNILLLLLTWTALQATPPQAELKLGYFYFGDHQFRKIYHQDALDTQISASGAVWKWLRLYGAVNYISRDGRSIGGHHKTQILFLPVSLGLESMISISDDVKYYATLGPRYFYIHQENHSPGVHHSVNAQTLGGFVNTGIQVHFGSSFFIDFFGEYSYARVHFSTYKHNTSTHTHQVGGLTLGGGLGYRF
ncbi:MAG: hypothetical protein ACRDFB_02720 [Rhabdochlamydiaceae bacterium]